MDVRQLMPRQVGRAVHKLRRYGAAAIASPTSPRGVRTVLLASAFCGLLLSGLLVWTSSESAFGGSTQSANNNWAAGTVTLDNDSSGAMFTSTDILPGDTGQKCIQVNYTGSLPSDVKLYVSSLTGSLGPYLTVTVEQGTGGTSSSCASFVAETSTSATLDTLPTTYAGGFGTWAPTGIGQSKSYRFSWSVAANNGAVSKSATATFTWKGQTS